MGAYKPFKHHLNLVIVGLLLVSLMAGLPVQPATAQDLPAWQDTSLSFNSADFNYLTCFDSLQPGKLLTASPDNTQPTFSIDLTTGQKTQLNALSYYLCNEATGVLYARANPDAKNGIGFTSASPAGVPLTYAPTHWAVDGSLWVYNVSNDNQTPAKTHLYASPDGGVTWHERNTGGFNGQLLSLTVTNSDGRFIYALTQDVFGNGRRFTLYASQDAGVSWEKRYEKVFSDNNGILTPWLYFANLPGRTIPTNYVELNESVGAGSNGTNTILISADGGKTFNEAGVNGRSGGVQILYSDNSLVRMTRTDYSYSLANSVDGGKTWQPLNLPFTPEKFDPNVGVLRVNLIQAKNAPSNLFFSYADGTKGDLWYSPDSGKTWQKLGPNMPNLLVSPYAPTSLLSFKDNKIFRLDISLTDKTQTHRAAFNNAPGGTYFDSTHHNLSGIFYKYWTDNGGLAQFGLPWTEPFRELNPADGKVYLVQYFERNRFEFHPENRGTQYEVLLGLLGNQQTEARRATGDGAFNRFDNAHYPGGFYFSETGHNLRNSFKSYWEANGGLAIYGFPISEEFEEVNPDDGKTYVVQYFERNRFEFHPENRGTRYEVLLGLLGNSLLKSKGWL